MSMYFCPVNNENDKGGQTKQIVTQPHHPHEGIPVWIFSECLQSDLALLSLCLGTKVLDSPRCLSALGKLTILQFIRFVVRIW